MVNTTKITLKTNPYHYQAEMRVARFRCYGTPADKYSTQDTQNAPIESGHFLLLLDFATKEDSDFFTIKRNHTFWLQTVCNSGRI